MQLHTSTKEQGAVSIIGVGFLLIMILVASFALDALEIMSTKSRLALAINNVISTVYSLPESQWVPAATRLLNSHFPESDISVTAMVTKTSNGCALSASASVPSLFIHKFSNSAAYSVTERVKLVSNPSATLPKREIALAVDVSDSMNGGYFDSSGASSSTNSNIKKITHLKKAVSALLTEADSDPDFQGRVRVSLIPHHARVNVGFKQRWVTGGDPKGECVQTRYPDFGITGKLDVTETVKQALRPPFAARIDYKKYRKPSIWLPAFCPRQPIIPLTNDFSKINQIVNSLDPIPNDPKMTAQDSGIIWAARTLLPSWGAAWGGSNNPSTSPSVDKHLVLVTDGQMHALVGSPQPEEILLDYSGGLCRKLKDAGITISIIEYHKYGTTTAFKNCASPGHYFTPVPSDPSDATALTDAVLRSLEKPVIEKNIILTDY